MLHFFCFLLSETVGTEHLLGFCFSQQPRDFKQWLFSLVFALSLHSCGVAYTACYFDRVLQNEPVGSNVPYLWLQWISIEVDFQTQYHEYFIAKIDFFQCSLSLLVILTIIDLPLFTSSHICKLSQCQGIYGITDNYTKTQTTVQGNALPSDEHSELSVDGIHFIFFSTFICSMTSKGDFFPHFPQHVLQLITSVIMGGHLCHCSYLEYIPSCHRFTLFIDWKGFVCSGCMPSKEQCFVFLSEFQFCLVSFCFVF